MNMKNDSFAREMAKIGKQAEAEQLAELKAERRRAMYAKVRKVMFVLVLVTAGGFAYQQRAELGQRWDQLVSKTGLSGGSGGSLTGYSEANAKLENKVQGLQGTAAKRNQMVDDITSTATPK